MRIGHGYDAHKLVQGSGMTLGGIEIKCDYSLEAHSDGDILVHALIDALLGAAAYGDLGTYFPSEDQSLKNISSLSMLSTVLEKLNSDGYKISNIDLTYVGQVPKILSYSKQIRQNLSTFINMDIENISCKATTTDHLGFEGKLEGISCHCVVLIERQ
ncbi:2-C-methyl-D-erythritol 2,4-cyclodiphosphate synthase [SAR86 cluster bacterium]|nr:2-C-methyl-D-erythritol 2,4-cyclodiphosphate synthase [SAR86 cluster bacterium]